MIRKTNIPVLLIAISLTACGGSSPGTASPHSASKIALRGVVRTADLSPTAMNYYAGDPKQNGSPCDVRPSDITFFDAGGTATAVAHPSQGRTKVSGSVCTATFTVSLPRAALYEVQYGDSASKATLDASEASSGDTVIVETTTRDQNTWTVNDVRLRSSG